MLRFGELLYDEKAKYVPEVEKLFKVITEGKVLWREFVHERERDDTHRQISVSLIKIDPDGVINTMKLPLAIIGKAVVEFSVPEGWRFSKAYLLDPDAKSQCVELMTSEINGSVQVNVDNIASSAEFVGECIGFGEAS